MAQLQAVLQSVPSGIIAVNERQELTLVNQKAAELLEVLPGQVIGRRVSEVIPSSVRSSRFPMSAPLRCN
jgi:sensor histidine kinase regulating citrate/malate metabolism